MGTYGPGARAEGRVQPLSAAPLSTPHPKPPAARLYGRVRGHALRPRQVRLMQAALPRLRVALADAGTPTAWFGQPPARLALEVGFGGGEHARALACDPALGVVACEAYEAGIASMLSALVPDAADEATAPLPPNLRLWDDDARILLRAMPDGCLDLLALMFPDPWPKARHAKRRFVHPAQVVLAARVLRAGGEWRVASDDPTYQGWVRDVMGAQPYFGCEGPVTARPQGWPGTRYEAKALRAGRVPLYWSFIRNGGPAAAQPELGWTQAPRPREEKAAP